mmetsp:Transcript_23889/g.40565  ORF Transcript_23889/g.40565 Transcript_23889/m.40565 type:complete len:187 (-) Transcript_23889:1396-1956(-)
MFLPNSNASEEKAKRRKVLGKVEKWGLEIIPQDIRKDVQLTAQEIQCGDPDCAPIDTVVTIVFGSGGRGMLGLPMHPNDVTKELLEKSFPTEDVLRKWFRGEEADWPPERYDDGEMPGLRFEVGTRVECRIGPSQWAPGHISQLWYRESNWPPDSWAPYRIRLDDGRDIFAPGDMDQIIRKERTDN